MNITAEMTDGPILELIGLRLTRIRLAKNLTQAQLAREAGLGLRTVQRLESGEAATQLAGFVRVLRVLGLLERLEALLPQEPASPIQQLKLRGHERRRASRPRTPRLNEEPGKWTWGEQA